ncbi:DUF2884 family protein [Thaumasiovibrio sp. DFM-14]|uniref:DUF2884 family protein n=1 Tax=Thaumasiovibrio sp. DFM-14 TaxID=3384792 RepID=UPI0039A2F03C
MRLGLMLLSLVWAGSALGSQCLPMLHNDIATRDGNLLLVQGGETFTVSDQGGLKFAVHHVSLRSEQTRALAEYRRQLMQDLPYMHTTLRSELDRVVGKVDQALAAQLGEQSASRQQLTQFQQQLNSQLQGIFGAPGSDPQFRHQRVLLLSEKIEQQFKTLLVQLGVTGMGDLARLPTESGEDKMAKISERMGLLQEELQGIIELQQPQMAALNQDFCQRLARWQTHEQQIQALIPALKEWQTVTLSQSVSEP